MEIVGTQSESTKKLYMHNLVKLNNDKPITSIAFLKKIKNIMEVINAKPKTTGRTYLIAVVSFLKEKDAKLHEKYHKLMMESNKELSKNPVKSIKQEENWISQEEVLEKQKELMKYLIKKKTLSEEEYTNLLSLVVLSLFTLQEPRRSADYYKMKIGSTIDDKDWNWYDGKFVFNNYKTKGKYLQQSADVSKELADILKIYLKHKPKNEWFLTFFDGKPFIQNSITRILNKVFGKNISVSMLRNIRLTNQFGGIAADLKDAVNAMGTSVDVALNHYIKTE